MDLRPICKFEFVRRSPVQKTKALHISWFNCGSLTNSKKTFFQIATLRFLLIFDKIQYFSKKKIAKENPILLETGKAWRAKKTELVATNVVASQPTATPNPCANTC